MNGNESTRLVRSEMCIAQTISISNERHTKRKDERVYAWKFHRRVAGAMLAKKAIPLSSF